MFDTEEYYGGTYPSPFEDEEQEDFDYGAYIDYCYENYKDNMLMKEMEEDNNE